MPSYLDPRFAAAYPPPSVWPAMQSAPYGSAWPTAYNAPRPQPDAWMPSAQPYATPSPPPVSRDYSDFARTLYPTTMLAQPQYAAPAPAVTPLMAPGVQSRPVISPIVARPVTVAVAPSTVAEKPARPAKVADTPWYKDIGIISTIAGALGLGGLVYWLHNKEISGLFGTTSSHYRITMPKDIKKTMNGVIGSDHVKDQAWEAVNEIKAAKAEAARTGKPFVLPKRAYLFLGEPGTGKTSMAQIIAKEADVPLIEINATNIFDKYVGSGAAKLKEIYNQARKYAPCIVLFDEADILSTVRQHADNSGSARAHLESIGNWLGELDGPNENNGVFTIATSNMNPKDVDTALLQRNTILGFDKPNTKDRQAHLAKLLPEIESRDLASIAELTSGLAPREILNLTDQAHRIRRIQGENKVTLSHLTTAFLRGFAGNPVPVNGLDPTVQANFHTKTIPREILGPALTANLLGIDIPIISLLPYGPNRRPVVLPNPSLFQLETASPRDRLKKVLLMLSARAVEQTRLCGVVATPNDLKMARQEVQHLLDCDLIELPENESGDSTMMTSQGDVVNMSNADLANRITKNALKTLKLMHNQRIDGISDDWAMDDLALEFQRKSKKNETLLIDPVQTAAMFKTVPAAWRAQSVKLLNNFLDDPTTDPEK